MPDLTEETFRGNKVAITVVVLLGALVAFLAYSVLSKRASRDLTTVLFFFVMFGVLAAVLAYLFSLRVSIRPYGISKQSWFGSKELRWDDVERFFYSATKRSVNFIPIGTYYTFKLVDREGNKIAFGNSVERPSELGQKLVKSTFEPLYRKAAQPFDSGAELEFGPIKLSRDGGLKIKGLFKEKHIPLNQVSDYRIGEGHFYIFKVGEKRTTGPAISRIPNAFVLLGLLDAIYRRKA